MIRPKIKELRLVVSDQCPYSCLYCNLYFKKLLDSKKISSADFNKQYIIGNESYSLLYKKDKNGNIFNLSDYKFLFSVLVKHFGLEDITFSGGDPFLNQDLKAMINSAHRIGLRTTAISKGAPLFNIKSKADARKKLGNLSRIIISVDTLDAAKYAKNNLPLVKKEAALKYLPKTLKIINLLSSYGYNIEVNSVIEPCLFAGKGLTGSFRKTNDIINFCLDNGVSKVKFIELDSSSTMGKPYIEKYFLEMIKAGYFPGANISPWNKNKKDKIVLSSNTEIFSIPRSGDDNMKVMAYRTHCPSCRLSKSKVKDCEFSRGGELHLDFSGKSFLCQKDTKFKFIDISQAVKNRDSIATIKGLLLINKEIKAQKCKF